MSTAVYVVRARGGDGSDSLRSLDEAEAVQHAKTQVPRGEAIVTRYMVWGVEDGDPDTFAEVFPYCARPVLVWGYRKSWDGSWGYGWADNRDAPVNDPEYAEFMRLLEKFAPDSGEPSSTRAESEQRPRA